MSPLWLTILFDMGKLTNQVAIVTGASSGFGEAIARLFAAEGAQLAIGARRVDRLQKLASELKSKYGTPVFFQSLDVRDFASTSGFVAATKREFGKIDILVNNAGLALGRRDIVTGNENDWQTMLDTNIMGLFRMTRSVLEVMIPQGKGHVLNIGSIAGHFAYDGGGGYCASKFGVNAITQTLRMETLGKGIKVGSIDPGLAETEFGIVRFGGDREKAKKVYEGMTPLRAEDIAECALFFVTRPPHVNIDDMILTPLDQAGVFKVNRKLS